MKKKTIISAILVASALFVLSQMSQLSTAPTGFVVVSPNFPWGLAVVVISFLGIVYNKGK